MKKIRLTINGTEVYTAPGTTILEAAKEAGIKIPTLCYLKGINDTGACRMCVVEVEGKNDLVSSCNTLAEDGMVIQTNTKKIQHSRRTSLELILSDHPFVCATCTKDQTCELQKIADELDYSMYYGFYRNPVTLFRGQPSGGSIDMSGYSITRDSEKCIRCRRCVEVCDKIQSVHAIRADENGFASTIVPFIGSKLSDTDCVSCGQCVRVCPTGALQIRDDVDKVKAALADPDKVVICQTAPSVRVGLAEACGAESGTVATGKMVSAIRKLGFDKVFDTNFGADLTIMEEANELIERVKSGGDMPMFTSCCPAWVRFAEEFYPDMTGNLSTSKSPQAMFGAVLKTWYAQKNNIDPEKIVCVSVMPCTAKKSEIAREEMMNSGLRNVDISITVVELARLMKAKGVYLDQIDEKEFDSVMGDSTGAAALFGASGGVMEAALRTAVEASGGKHGDIEFREVRGARGIREASVDIGGKTLKVAMVSGLANARDVLDGIKAGELCYDFVEVMACPGGCINGGGMPASPDKDVRTPRTEGIYKVDRSMQVRKSHENSSVQALYDEFLGKPLSAMAEDLLHRTYEEV